MWSVGGKICCVPSLPDMPWLRSEHMYASSEVDSGRLVMFFIYENLIYLVLQAKCTLAEHLNKNSLEQSNPSKWYSTQGDARLHSRICKILILHNVYMRKWFDELHLLDVRSRHEEKPLNLHSAQGFMFVFHYRCSPWRALAWCFCQQTITYVRFII